jgi:3-oxoacyl-(acyl-carrier-protein) synthase
MTAPSPLPAPALMLALPADALEREALGGAIEALAPLMEGAAGVDSALLVVSDNAGGASALRFWADAQRSGVGLANPELFPWCLANSPGAALSRRFGLAGPNITWLDGPAGQAQAWQAAQDLLRSGRAARVFLVVLRLGQDGQPGWLHAWVATAADTAQARWW